MFGQTDNAGTRTGRGRRRCLRGLSTARIGVALLATVLAGQGAAESATEPDPAPGDGEEERLTISVEVAEAVVDHPLGGTAWRLEGRPVSELEENGLGEPFAIEPDAELEEAIREASRDYTRQIVATGGIQARYLHGRYDLNGDGRDEVFAYLMGSFFCGTGGCNLLLFSSLEDGYILVNTFPISRLPVVVSDEKNQGWSDLLKLESGGGAPSCYVRYVFDGEKYIERERLPTAPPPKGTKVLAGGHRFEHGIPLAPRG